MEAAWAMARGVLVASSVTIVAIAAFALILNWWNAGDRAIAAINQVIKFVSILAGVSSGIEKEKKATALRGCLIGFLYMLLGIVCYCFMMGQTPVLSAYLADLGMGIAAGGLFAMILESVREGGKR